MKGNKMNENEIGFLFKLEELKKDYEEQLKEFIRADVENGSLRASFIKNFGKNGSAVKGLVHIGMDLLTMFKEVFSYYHEKDK